MTDLIILATLLPGPKHGYQLKHEAGIILGQESLHNNLVYPLLRRFMNNKWVTRKTVPGERGQTRQRYALTTLGRNELLARLSEFTEQDAQSPASFRFRVSLFQLVGADVRHRILEVRANFLRSRMAKLTAIQTNFPLDPYARDVVSLYREETHSELKWIKRLERREKSRRG